MSMDLSPLYDASFGGVSFMELVEDAFTALSADIAEEFALLHIPGGNTSVYQSFGLLPQQVGVPVAINASGLLALVAKVGTSGTLVYHGGSITCRMSGITNRRKDALAGNTWNMTLQFVRLA